MKKAEEYVEENNFFNDFFLKEELSGEQIRDEIEKTIKQAQIDAIEYAVKMCAKDAETEYIPEDGLATGNYYDVNEQSILNVIDKIKKEINDD